MPRLACSLLLLAFAAGLLAVGAARGDEPARDPAFRALPFGDESVGVRSDGCLGRMVRDRNWKRAYEGWRKVADACKVPPVPWRTRIYVLRAIDADWKDGEGKTKHTTVSFTDEQIATFRRVAEAFVDEVHVYSGGRARLDAQVEVLDGPLTVLDGEGDMVHPWDRALDQLLEGKLRPADVDSIVLFWPSPGVPHRNVWGLTAWGAWHGAGYSWVAWLGGEIDERAYTEVALHEWLHQMEGARTTTLGYPGLPTLHDAGKMGYRANEIHPGWMLWYRDFMSTYMTPGMWSRLHPREARPRRHGPSFEGGFVDAWLVAGPFPDHEDTGLERDFVHEADVLPQVGEGAPPWRKVEIPGGILDLGKLLTPNEDVVAYAHVYVRSRVRRVARVWVGSDDGLYVFWNGGLVWRDHVHRGLEQDQDTFRVILKPGWNRLLFKVDQGGGPWQLQARLSTEDGRPLEGVEYSAAKPEDDSPIVTDDVERVPAEERWTLRHYAWEVVRDDPWRLLPLLETAELRTITGNPALEVTSGDACTALSSVAAARDPAERAAPAKMPEVSDDRLNAVLDFRRESVAILPFERGGVSRTLLLLRADVAPYWLSHLDAEDDPSYSLLGRVHVGRRPLLVLEARLRPGAGGGSPSTELGLLEVRDESLAANLLLARPEAAVGEPMGLALRLRNRTEEPLEVSSWEVVDEDGTSFAASEAPLELAAKESRLVPANARLPDVARGALRLLLRVHHDEAKEPLEDVDVLRIVPPLELEVHEGRTTEALRVARSGERTKLEVEVQNHRGKAVEAGVGVALPDGWKVQRESEGPLSVSPYGHARLTIDLQVPRDSATPAPDPTTPLRFRITAKTAAEPKDEVEFERAFVRSPWLLIGPFDNEDEAGFATAYPPETKPFDAGAVYEGKAGAVRWFDLVPAGARAGSDFVDLRAVMRPGENGVAYARRDLVLDHETKAILHLGSDDTLTVFLDGRVLLAKNVYRPAAPDQEQVPVTLHEGANHLLLKVCQGGGDWGFYFRATTPEGDPLPIR